MPHTLPLARTNAEARLFLQLQPCPRCGSDRCAFRSTVVTVDGQLASRYSGECAGCGERRVYEFRVPEEVLPPPAGSVRFGADDPSELLDPGVWLWYADICARQIPLDGTELDDRARQAGRHAAATALAAVEEVLKFFPPGEDRLPASAFVSADGQAMYAREPGRFTRWRLEAVRDSYAETLARW
ncbi:hypothetical protein [Nocardia blacklockiae]|uniref:hypothetical protein n=1 Tax=Nocardia blacklockiae TaxID=480036 RepID=UPI001E2C8EE5|nr:hypothetical protein [Nocardia blacklockiae]